MLLWLKFFLIFFFLIAVSLLTSTNSLFSILITAELLLVYLVFLFIFLAVNFNINFMIGLSLCYLTLGGLELALNFILFLM